MAMRTGKEETAGRGRPGTGAGSMRRRRHPAARHPTGVAKFTTIDFGHVADYSPAGLPAYFDRTVTVLDNSPASNPIDDKVATLGRVLFHDLRLSTNNRASCSGCHQQAIGFTPISMRFSNGISTAATTDFHAMRLGNLRYWQPGSTFWDRRAASVEAQASHPFHSLVEMGWGGAAGGFDALIRKMNATPYYPDLFAWAFGSAGIDETRIQQALAQFVRAMVSSSSRWDTGYAKVFSPTAPNRALDVDLPNFTPQENRGRHLFMAPCRTGGAGCSSCHPPAQLRPGRERAEQRPGRRRDAAVQGAFAAQRRADRALYA